MASEKSSAAAATPTANARLLRWVEEVAELTQPEAVHWCDGSSEEYDRVWSLARDPSMGAVHHGSAVSPPFSARRVTSAVVRPDSVLLAFTGV